MSYPRIIFGLMLLLAVSLRGCGSKADIGVAVVNNAGAMINNCIVHFAKGDLNTGVVLTNTRREFSYFDKPISESATVDVLFTNGTKKTMRVYIGSKYDPKRPGTLVFEIGMDAVNVKFEDEA